MRSPINKVPDVTLSFWIIKMMSTTVGETAADFLNAELKLGLTGTSVVTAALLTVALVFQIRARRYVPSLYWLTVALTSVFGTLIADNLTDHLSLPLVASAAVFGFALMAVFAAWYAHERTPSIHHIDSMPRESFYWLAILVTFALGTAVGDWFAEGLQLGYATSALVFGAAIAVVAGAHYVFKADAVLCFWVAYILTRPFGASVGDLLSQPHANGGLAMGAAVTSATFLGTIAVLVTYLSMAQERSGRVG